MTDDLIDDFFLKGQFTHFNVVIDIVLPYYFV